MTRFAPLCSVLFLVTLVFSIVGCGKESAPASSGGSSTPSEAAPKKVSLALNWVPEPEFGGFYTARETGLYRKQGLDVDIKPGGAGAPVAQRVATGDVEFGIVSADEILLLRPKGADIVAIFTVYQTCPQGLMVHASRKLTSIEQVFQGGTLAVEPGNAYVAYLKKKYDLSKVNLVPYQGGIARFLVEKDFGQQCFVFAEPIAAQFKGVEPQVFLIADTGYNPYTAVVATRASYLKENRATVEAFVRATRAGWAEYLRDPKATNDVIGKLNPQMDGPALAAGALAQERLIEDEQTKKNGLGTMTLERWQELSDQLRDIGKLEKATPVIEAFVNIP